MHFGELIDHLQTVGKDPSRLIFEDELTGLYNRRFLLSFFEHKVRWDRDESFPMSLLLMDVDLFKAINDAYGHEAGDEALVFVAALLREAAGDRGHAVRYGGDEFVLLLPGADMAAAVACADRLHRLTKARSLRLSSGKGRIGVCLSIGVASARADAESAQELLRKADSALYTSKKLGRNRVSLAAEIDPEKTYSRTALHRLADARVAGREGELARVSEYLSALQLGESRFLVIEGAPGLGKTTLLEGIARGLSSADGQHVVRLSGRIQEGFRPYYLIGELLLTLLRARPDGAEDAISSLTRDEVDYVSHVLPQLPSGLAEDAGSDPRRREGIFVTLVQIITRLVRRRPLVLLVDDLPYADEGSLMLLRLLFVRREISILVCGTTTESVAPMEDGETAPWEAFREAHGRALSIEELRLEPLGPADIVRHVSEVFPGIELPGELGGELARLTQGNPLFLEEILRRLVADRKLVLEGQRWKVEPFGPDYLPRSLEEVVAREIEGLDTEARALLQQASAMGENVSLSQLTGAADVSESRVLEFLDRAEARGLLRADFHLNDETMRFLGKRVLEIVYGSIEGERRRELHGRVGSYHEDLHRQGLGASATILAYHFKRSADREKASRYDRLRRDIHQKTFDREEALGYTGEPLLEEEDLAAADAERPPPEALGQLPHLFRALLTSVRNVQLYPKESQAVQKGFLAAREAAGRLLESVPRIRLSRSRGALLANGLKVDVGEFRLLARSYLELLERCELEAIELRRGVEESELRLLLVELGSAGSGSETVGGGHWRRFVSTRGLSRIALEQTRYSEIRRRRGGREPTSESGAPLGDEELEWVPRILRALTGAAKNIQLYPLGSRPVTESVSQLETALSGLLRLRALVTFSAANDALIVNGARVGTSGFEALAERFLLILQEAELTSVTFRETVTTAELEVFIQGLEDGSRGAPDPTFWTQLAERKGLAGIVLNDRRYTSGLLETLIGDDEEDDAEEEDDEAEPLDPASDDIPLTDALPTLGRALLDHGEDARLSQLLTKLFRGYDERDEDARDDLLRGCRNLMDSLVQAHQHRLAERAVDYWLSALRDEGDLSRLRELAALLHRAATVALTFGDTTTASRAWAGIRERNRERLQDSAADGASVPDEADRGRALLVVEPDASTNELLLEELRSPDPARRESAAQVLESLGELSIPVLIAVIKQEKDYRTRKLAAGLLARLGEEAAERIKREVLLEITIEQRCRVLEVIEIVTHDLKKELAFCLTDVNAKVRRAAFRLTERLGNRHVVELLVDLAHHADIGIAKGAMRSLASLRSPHAVGALSASLGVTKDPERVTAIVQALAQLGDPGAVPSLRRLVVERRMWRFGRFRFGDQVRATAAFALAQIGGDQAAAALAELTEDADPRIREIARRGMGAARVDDD